MSTYPYLEKSHLLQTATAQRQMTDVWVQ